jgi:long-chain acyl-CoA synthetase
MRGYYGHPEETSSAFTNGWFTTGDVGHLDDQGHLYITDRKKDLFKLSNGKYVAPQQIESLLKQSEFVSQVVVVGAGRKQPVALVVPEWEAVTQALSNAGEEYPAGRVELAAFPPAIKLIQSDVALLTRTLADYERIRRIALLPNEFSIDNGEMTPTLKVKRRIIDQKFGDLIDDLYS